MSDDKLVEAHGAFHNAHCVVCHKEHPDKEWVKQKILVDEVPKCQREGCDGTVKPDIVFFGENLPERFFRCMRTDFQQCDLLIILGTSLLVQPFASLKDRVGPSCPRLLINREKVGEPISLEAIASGGGLRFEGRGSYRDVAWLGSCDQGCKELATLLGWDQDLEQLVSENKSVAGKDQDEASGEMAGKL